MIEIRLIDSAHKQDINIRNEPFPLWGRMIPSYTGEKWGYTLEKRGAEEIEEMCFPDESYDYDSMQENSIFIGAYDGEKCVGLAILQKPFLKFMYLYDLKVNRAYRQQGISTLLIKKAAELAKENGYCGLYTQGQDNNLSACLFYLKAGFHIGGLDTDVYRGTGQEGKADILFYLDI